jgi:hypothetical protein
MRCFMFSAVWFLRCGTVGLKNILTVCCSSVGLISMMREGARWGFIEIRRCREYAVVW